MIYITGDTHAYFDKRYEFFKSLTNKDILIVLGDFGFSWGPKTEEIWNKQKFPFTTLTIYGNHENFDRIKETYEETVIYGGKCYKFSDNTYYIQNGEMLNIEGRKFFCFGGALSIDKQQRLPHLSWWPDEQPSQREYSHALQTLKENNYTFDYFLTHDATDDLNERMFGYRDIIKSSTTRMIQELLYEIREHEGSFKAHYFAHHHRFSAFGNHMCLYEQIYCLDNNQIISS